MAPDLRTARPIRHYADDVFLVHDDVEALCRQHVCKGGVRDKVGREAIHVLVAGGHQLHGKLLALLVGP